MNMSIRGILMASMLLPSAAFAQGTASLSTNAQYQYSLYTTQLDGYHSSDGSQVYGGTGNYTGLPGSTAGAGGGSTSAGGSARLSWDGTVSAPVNSTAYMNGLWSPTQDADGNPLPIWHISNATEFHTSLHVLLSYNFAVSGVTSGDAGINVVNLASFGLFCSSCTGLPSNAFTGSQSYSAGNLFGAGTGAFNDTASGSWELELTLAPFSDADFYATLASDVTMAAQARAVPEPQSWMMMVFGAGAVGYGTRRRRRLALA